VGALLRGETRLVSEPALYALSALTGEETPVTRAEVELAIALPADAWTEAEAGDANALRALAAKGVVVCEEGDERLAELRRRDERLDGEGWNLYGALYYFMTKWRDVDLRAEGVPELAPLTRAQLEGYVAEQGPPPSPFHALDGDTASVELPLARREGGLYDALAGRKTTREFAAEPLTLDELALVLYEVYGVHATAPIVGELISIKRTSPSGGGLHPVEAYPLVANVEGIAPGLYHYRAEDHVLELVEALAADEVRTLTARFVCGQTYFASAAVSIVLTARFFRNHWKYRRHQKALGAILMDAAHLSQTLYLVAAELGLGAYVTAAVNALEIEERLGLDGYGEGVLAVSGFGRRPPGRSRFEPNFTPYVPRARPLSK
jgi:putative peptide maturation dehydrogenase